MDREGVWRGQGRRVERGRAGRGWDGGLPAPDWVVSCLSSRSSLHERCRSCKGGEWVSGRGGGDKDQREEDGGGGIKPCWRWRRSGRRRQELARNERAVSLTNEGWEENDSARIPQDVELWSGSFGSELPRPRNYISIFSLNAQPQYLSHPNTKNSGYSVLDNANV
jgi:hypothetical protein